MAAIVQIKELEIALRGFPTRTDAALRRGLWNAGRRLQRASMRMVPVQTTTLKGSAFTKIEMVGSRPSVVVGYATGYALIVHENPDAAHGEAFNIKHADRIARARKDHPIWFKRGKNQQYKYLERPFRQLRKRLIKLVTDEVGNAHA